MTQARGITESLTTALWRAAPFLGFLFVLVVATTAAAEDPAPTEPTEPPDPRGEVQRTGIVVISGLGNREDTVSIEHSVLAQLADLNISVYFHNAVDAPPPAELEALARDLMQEHSAAAAFIIFGEGSRVVLRTLLHTGDRLESTHRTVDVARGSPLHETLAVIVRAATTALIERGQHSEPVETPPPPVVKPSRPPDPPLSAPPENDREGKRLYLEVGGAMGFYAKGFLPWFGLSLGVGGQPIRHLNLHIGYTALSEVQIRKYDVRLTLKRHPIRISLGYSDQKNRLLWGSGLALNIDYVTETISSQNVNMDLRPGSELHLGLTGYFCLGIQLLDSLSFFLNLEAEVPLYSTRYRVATSSGDRVILELLPVQPALITGFRVHFF